MILQGGDLFHINKPTRKSMYDVITAVRTACYGDKPCELELLNEVDLGLEKEYVFTWDILLSFFLILWLILD